MKQKRIVIAVLFAVLLLQTGCGAATDSQQTLQPAQTEQEQDSASKQPSALDLFLSASEEEPEEKSVDLQVSIGGERKTVAAVPYTGGRYSIAIVKTWERLPNEPRWQPPDDDSASLTIRYFTGKKTDDAVTTLKKSEKGYDFHSTVKTRLPQEDSVSMLRGVKTEEGEDAVETKLTAYFIELERGGTYALLLRAHGTAGEQYEGYLKAMANSFALTDPLRISVSQ